MSWGKVKLGDLYVFQKKSKIKAGDGLKDGKYNFYTSSETLTKYLDEYQFETESLIFGTGGKASVHFCAEKFSVSTDCFVTHSIDHLDVFNKYVYHYLHGNIFLLEEGFKGAGLKHISKEYLQNIQIPLPPLSTQKQITKILDKADALRKKDLQLLKHYDALAQSLFIDMFGDPIRNEKGWEVQKIGELARVSSGSTPSRSQKEYYGGNISWVKTTEVNGNIIVNTEETISEDGLSNSSCKLYPINSIIIAMYGQGKTRGQVGLLGIIAATNQACGVIVPSTHYNSLFLYNYLKLSYLELRKLGRGGNQENLNTGMIKDYKVITPPISLQNQFATQIQNIELQKEKVKAQIQSSENLFQALLQKAFS